jgi:peptidoglycan/LPS O-acetylase OafA/YrhL
MPPKFSTYLDVVRFTAALTVFLGHAAGRSWTGSFLWQLGAYADTCVVVFFVLSGYVIGYVCDTKEKDWRSYFVNRAARLWSVVIPALMLTFVIDYAGIRIAPELYVGQAWYAGDMLLLRYIASFLMVQEFWHVSLVPGINAPFWSLSFEAVYYVVFGIAFFSRSRWKWLAVVIALLLSGPFITLLLPIWLLGFYSYGLTKRLHLSNAVNFVAFMLGFAILLMSPLVRSSEVAEFTVLGEHVFGRYVDAVGFFFNLIGAYGLCTSAVPLSARFGKVITNIASATFVLYLFHRPLIQMFSYLGPADPSSWGRRVLVIGGTLLVVYLATPATEYLRRCMRSRGMQYLSASPTSPLAKIR